MDRSEAAWTLIDGSWIHCTRRGQQKRSPTPARKPTGPRAALAVSPARGPRRPNLRSGEANQEPQRLIHRRIIGKDLCHIRSEKDEIRALGITLGVLPAHAIF